MTERFGFHIGDVLLNFFKRPLCDIWVRASPNVTRKGPGGSMGSPELLPASPVP